MLKVTENSLADIVYSNDVETQDMFEASGNLILKTIYRELYQSQFLLVVPYPKV